MTTPSLSTSSGQPFRYAVLQLGEQRLLLPQNEVLSLEPIQDLDRSKADGAGRAGHIALAGKQAPAYCLTEGLELTETIPENYHLCVLLLDRAEELFSILCSNVTIMEAAGCPTIPIPDCMRLPNTPIRSLVLNDGEVLCTTTASNLEAIIECSREPAAMAEA